MIISRRGPASVSPVLPGKAVMISPTKRWLVAATTAVLAAVAGCSTATDAPAPSAGSESGSGGGNGSSDSGTDGACGSGSGFCITVDVTGAKTVHGTGRDDQPRHLRRLRQG